MARAPAGDDESVHKYDAAADLERKGHGLDVQGDAKATPRDQVGAPRSPNQSLRLAYADDLPHAYIDSRQTQHEAHLH